MIFRPWAACLLLFIFVGSRAESTDSANHPNLRQAPLPAWFTPLGHDLVAASQTPLAGPSSSGLEYLLFDRQVEIGGEASTMHIAYRVTSEAGLSSAAQLNFKFDPSYQRLTLHFIRLAQRRGA